jgi:hypothetical protein
MIKRILPLLIGLSVVGVTYAQNMPGATPSMISATQTLPTITTWGSSPPTGALSEEAIKTAIGNAGYQEVMNLEFKAGVWRTKARGGNHHWVKLAVGPVSGKVYAADAPSKLNEDEVNAKLATTGYLNIKHVKFDDGLWSADARTSQGDHVALLVDPNDGSVVARSHR